MMSIDQTASTLGHQYASKASELIDCLLHIEKTFTSDKTLETIPLTYHHPLADELKALGVLKENGLVEKNTFFAQPWLWHRAKSAAHFSEAWTETGSVKHPLRPQEDDGVLYRRYIPVLDKHISFEVLDLDRHLDVFHQWHNQRRVYKFWELNQSKEELRAYLEKIYADPHHFPAIAAVDGVPSGYFEIYWAAEDRLGPYYDCQPHDRGFHFLIGNARHLGRDYFNSFVESISHFLFLNEPRTGTLLAEPRADNIALLHYLEEFPYWEKRYEFDFPHKRAALLACRRKDFFQKASFV